MSLFIKSNKAKPLSEPLLNSLFQYAMSLSNHRDNAYDLLQSALEKYLSRLQQPGTTIDNPQAFLQTLIRNQFIDQYRYQQRWPSETFEEFASYDISPLSLEQLAIDTDSLQRIWRQLSPQDRDILYHWAILGYSTDEACELLGMARGTFLSRIHRLRKQLNTKPIDKAPGTKEPSS